MLGPNLIWSRSENDAPPNAPHLEPLRNQRLHSRRHDVQCTVDAPQQLAVALRSRSLQHQPELADLSVDLCRIRVRAEGMQQRPLSKQAKDSSHVVALHSRSLQHQPELADLSVDLLKGCKESAK